MKRSKILIVAVVLAVAGTWCVTSLTGCNTPPDARVVEVRTLLVVGEAAKASMDSATLLLKNKVITLDQWRTVADLYDVKFQGAYKVAILTAKSDLSPASPDLIAIAAEIANLVTQLSKKEGV